MLRIEVLLQQCAGIRRGEIRVIRLRRISLCFFQSDEREALLLQHVQERRQDFRAEGAEVQQQHMIDIATL